MAKVFHQPSQGRGRLSLITCESGRAFAERVQTALQTVVQEATGSRDTFLRASNEIEFANGEFKTVISENIRGDDVYVFQCLDDPSSHRSVNDNLMALVTALHAASQSDAESITAVVPQYPYSRQERKKTREGITARVIANLLEDVGADRVITLDIHAPAIMGFFDRCVLENLHASGVILSYFKKQFPLDDLVVVAPDVGGADMARYYSNRVGCPLAIVDKQRDYSRQSVIESMRLVGDVEGRNVLMPDDMVATGGTLINACKHLRERGARRIVLACSLPFFNGKAVEIFDANHKEGLFEAMIGTDAVPRGPEFMQRHPWYHEVSVAGLFAQVVFNINQKLSVSELLK
jgi:ribose-phosphate pyrophosphokinase